MRKAILYWVMAFPFLAILGATVAVSILFLVDVFRTATMPWLVAAGMIFLLWGIIGFFYCANNNP